MSMKVTDPIERSVARSHTQIVERIKALAPKDYFGFQTADLLAYLPWDAARPFLQAEASESEWRAKYPVFEPPLRAAKDYMKFAWDKANKQRGISALRSLEHYRAWLWLGGYSEHTLDAVFNDYDWYGKGQLVFAATLLQFNWRDCDDRIWVQRSNGPRLHDEARLAECAKWIGLADLAEETRRHMLNKQE